MEILKYSDLPIEKHSADAILNQEYTGFEQDYLVLHYLIKEYKPKTFAEVGTSVGDGTNIICNAGKDWGMMVASLDLPPELAHMSLQHPHLNGFEGTSIGHRCKFPYRQLLGDSMFFDWKPYYPIEGWWIDAQHETKFVLVESYKAINSGAKLIAYHDTYMPEVMKGIEGAFKDNKDYDLFRVTGSRITYALRRSDSSV